MVPQPQESGVPASQSTARIHLPIEGYTAWPQVMRLVAIASFVLIMLLACTMLLLVPEDSLNIRLEDLMIGLMVFLLFEMVLVRCLIIPRNGDYGRFRISEGRVDFYPLSTLGLSIQSRTQSVPVADFDGIAVQILEGRDGNAAKYEVLMVHPKRSNLIRIRYIASRGEAEDYARALADELKLPVIAAVPG